MSLLHPDGSTLHSAGDSDSSQPAAFRLGGDLRVVVTDIDMSMGSMCRFMVKWAIAAIPATLIIAVIWLLLAFLFGAMLHSFR